MRRRRFVRRRRENFENVEINVSKPKDIVQPKKRRVKNGINGFASTWYTIAAVLYVNLKGSSPVLSVLKNGYII
jgi:hypothetical protein